MERVVITSAVRTAGGAFGGGFRPLPAAALGAAVIREAVLRAHIPPEQVDQVIFGNAWQAGAGPNPARICAVQGGLPVQCPAFTVNIRCGSGLRAVQLGALSIAAGESRCVVVGGTESASNVPYLLPQARWGQRMGDTLQLDSLHTDGFRCALAGMFMGDTAGLLVKKYAISRAEQDAFAYASHQKAVAAMDSGAFLREIVPVEVPGKKGPVPVDIDEIPRRALSLEKMGRLAPAFHESDTVTAGNSSALCDGAAALVLMSETLARELGLAPLAVIRSWSFVGLEPREMGLGPVLAVPQALGRAGLGLKDIDLIELNEAFAAQVLACGRELDLDLDKVNVNGGAIALGHPVGATGAKLLTTLLYALEARDLDLGLVSLCIGGGQGVAMVVERL